MGKNIRKIEQRETVRNRKAGRREKKRKISAEIRRKESSLSVNSHRRETGVNPGKREHGKMTTLRGLQQAGAGPHSAYTGLTGQAIYGPSIGLVDPPPPRHPFSLLISIYLFLGLFF